MVLTRYRFPRREAAWVGPALVGLAIAALAVLGPVVADLVELLVGISPPRALPALASVLLWTAAGGAAVALKVGLPRQRAARIEIDVIGRAVRVDGHAHGCRTAQSVRVRVRPISQRARVEVHDADGALVFAIDDLRRIHANQLALDLSSFLGLYADPALGRPAEGHPVPGDRPSFVQGVHDVRIGLWSRPWRGALFGVFGTTPMLAAAIATVAQVEPWALIGIGMVVGSVVGVVALTVRVPVWVELQIRADQLVLRRGWIVRSSRVLAVRNLAPPRVVTNGAGRPSLALRSHEGFQIEIEDRPRDELAWVADWIEHARSQALPALPESAPEPDELRALRGRAKEPVR